MAIVGVKTDLLNHVVYLEICIFLHSLSEQVDALRSQILKAKVFVHINCPEL